MNLTKNESLAKLKLINNLYKELKKVKLEMDNVEVPDNYIRQNKLIDKPNCPTKVLNPGNKIYPNETDFFPNKLYKNLLIIFGLLCLLLILLLFDVHNIIFIIIDIQLLLSYFICLLIYIYYLIKGKKEYISYCEDIDISYDIKKKKFDKYIDEYVEYQSELNEYNVALQKVMEEEQSIKSVLEEEKNKIVENIKVRKYELLDKKLKNEAKEFINEKYFEELPLIIQLIEDGRADTIKEAINLLENIRYQQICYDLECKRIEIENENKILLEKYQKESVEMSKRQLSDIMDYTYELKNAIDQADNNRKNDMASLLKTLENK